jgi:N-acetylmuramoyl-L-alanine amidase
VRVHGGMPKRSLRWLLPALATLALAPAARAAPPTAAVQTSVVRGAAPLAVSLTATGDAVAWHWDFGDGTAADGQAASHAYAKGRWTATLTATSATGETTVVRTPVVAYALTLAAPARATFGTRVRFTGRLSPAEAGSVSLYHGSRRISTAKLRRGAYAITTTLKGKGDWYARFEAVRSPSRAVNVRPVLDARIDGAGVVGGHLTLRARVQPGGPLHVRVVRDGRETFERTFASAATVELGTSTPGSVRVSVSAAGARESLEATVVQPALSLGSRGASVRALESRLRELHYMLKSVDGLYAGDTYEAVLAFQKVNGLARTGRVDAALWRRLRTAHVPRARIASGNHIEVSKTTQVLMEVRNGVVANVLHVSTGATGNTPVGTWHVYRKNVGWDWVLWYPMYFKGGFAIHGYPSVPAYPASHGCVRVPMWSAPVLFSRYTYGATIVVFA